MKDLHSIGLLLGSNIAPEWNLPIAYQELSRRFQMIRASQIWESPAVGSNGPNYLNLAVLIQTSLDPLDLKNQVLRPLEVQLGRVRTRDKFAPRTIDIDIVTVGFQALDPGLWKYVHMAVPVAELVPDLQSPVTGESLRQAASRLLQETPIKIRRDGFGRLAVAPFTAARGGDFSRIVDSSARELSN